MKKIRPWMYLAVILAVVFAIYQAVQMGEAPGDVVTLKISATPELRESMANSSALFVTLKDPQSPMPMPLGAIRFAINGNYESYLDKEIVLTRTNVQWMQGQAENLPQNLTVKVRFDADGQGGADASGDVVGEAAQPVKLGTAGVQIPMSFVVP